MKLDPEESIYQAEELKDLDSKEEITSDNFEESSTSSPLETIHVITEFIDVFSKDNTLILLEVTPVFTEFVVVFSEDLLDKLPLLRDIQHAIKLDSEPSFPDLSHHRIDHVKYIEL